MYFHKLKSLITFFLSALLFSCVNSPPTHDLPVNTVTPIITDTITTDNVSVFQSTMPIITGHHFRFDSWSPDSKWIGYWVADNDDMPVYLGFASSQLDKTCIHIEVINVNLENGILLWQDDGSVYIFELSSDITFLGKPCETFSQVDNKIIIEDVNKHYSPNNQYQSITTIKKWDGQIIHNITEISEVSSKKVINTVEWKASPHAWAESGWLNNEFYLVGLDIERGTLYVSIPSGEVGKIITDLLSLKESNADYIFHVGHYANSETEHFYLLIERVSESAALPLLLFHSETNTVEEIPFSKSLIVNGSTFTPDGEWLFLSNPLPENDDATNF